MFLPSILPHILEGFQLTEHAAITTAGSMLWAFLAAGRGSAAAGGSIKLTN
jgi:hypothetical protein